MKGACACGSVAVSVQRKPEYINFCDCSLCRRVGAAWGYYDLAEVSVTGELTSFVRRDLDEVYLATEFCPTCGTTVRWVPLPDRDSQRAGVNMRLFDPAEIAGIESRFPSGLDWVDERPPPRHPPLPYGSGTVF